jgi:hypothetical protein
LHINSTDKEGHMAGFSLELLNAFVVRAKAATYIGGGARSLSRRPGSHDLEYRGGFEYTAEAGTYVDTNEGDLSSFAGREWITRGNVKVYELVYHGGLIKD